MALLAKLEYVASNLAIAYRASAQPQQLVVRMTSSETALMSSVYAQMLGLLDAINAGMACGREFQPQASSATVLRDTPHQNGPDYDWLLEVTAMSPRFLRHIVERLRAVSVDGYPTSMMIQGSLPLDNTPLSVTQTQAIAWLDDPYAYVEACVEPGFEMIDEYPPKGASVQLRLKGKASKKLLRSFHNALAIWNNMVTTYFDAKACDIGRLQGLHLASSTSELSARYDICDRLREPTRAALVNILGRFHCEVAPIEKAVIAL